MNQKTQGNIMLLITAIIWGSGFIAQSLGMDFVDPFTFNMTRNYLAFIVLIPVVWFFRKISLKDAPLSKDEQRCLNKRSVIGGIFCGLALGIASAFQQVGISMTTAGKAGFITALYIILVPILGIFIGKKIPRIIWLCVIIAVIGFYLLCVKEGFSISTGDLLCLACAICFSFHILIIDHFSAQHTDGVMMSWIQFGVAGIFSMILTFIFEVPTLTGIWNAKLAIIYAGCISSCVGYTLQILAQKKTDPTVASLLMSLESVFAALFGWLILHEVLSIKELIGCALVFIAVILAQLPTST